MKYFDYKEMKEFYTIAEVCHLFEMEKMELKRCAEKYGVKPVEDTLCKACHHRYFLTACRTS